MVVMKSKIKRNKIIIIISLALIFPISVVVVKNFDNHTFYIGNEEKPMIYDDKTFFLTPNLSYWDPQIKKSVGTNPDSVFIGDANSDGYNDIVAANYGDNNVSIILWNTTLSNWDTQITKSVGTSPTSVFIGDANNDGYNDIVTTNGFSQDVSILLWNNDAGDWDAQITKSVGFNPVGVFVGDADNDGYNDIITANTEDDNVSILLWNSGDWDAQITRSVGDEPKIVFVGDANNDGLNDIVTSNYGDNNISILLWNATSTNWDPQIKKSVGSMPYGLFIGDANNDELNDIVTANTGGNDVSIIMWNATSTNWDPQIKKSVGSMPYGLFIGDANNDELNDIVTANPGGNDVSIIMWNATSTNWDPQIKKSVGTAPTDVFIGDANNDGLKDIVTANYMGSDVSILLGLDKISPSIQINSPNQNEIIGRIAPTFNIEITDLKSDINTTWYTIDGGNTNFTFLSNNTINQSAWDYFGNVSVTLTFYANDTAGNIGFAEVIVRKDINLPIINLLDIDIINQSFSKDTFNITFYVYNASASGQGIEGATIQIWWDGTDVSLSVVEVGNGQYKISLDPIFVVHGGDPILLNMTINAAGFTGKYFETHIAEEPCEPCETSNLIYLKFLDQTFSTEVFNITFSVYNASGQGIEGATIQIWWDGTDVSSNVIEIGNGLYKISLTPILVSLGDDPILLKVTVSATGYENVDYELELAVDPATVEKIGEDFPFDSIILTIVISALVAGAGVIIAIVIIKKLKAVSK